jgi:hypothetical protein
MTVSVYIIRGDFVLTYSKGTLFHFTCYNVEDPNDPSIGLINGEIAIPGALLRTEVGPFRSCYRWG